MSCQQIGTRLDEWVDGTLSAAERREMERHLADCADCRRAEAELRELLERVASLPRSIEPAHDLWPGILDGITRQRVARPDFGGRSLRSWAPLLAAAALLLVIASSGLTMLFLNRAPDAPAAEGIRTVAWREFQAAEREYERVTDELLAVLDTRRNELSPETIEIVETNLELIDQAIRESRAALERDPSNAGLAATLSDIYRKRVDFLRAITRL